MGEHDEKRRSTVFWLVKGHVGGTGRGHDLVHAPHRTASWHCILQCNIIYVRLSINYFSYDYDINWADYIR
jgi:hypothetical protein